MAASIKASIERCIDMIRAKIFLVLFGLGLGGLLGGAALWILRYQNDGSEFENLSDLRSAMLKPVASSNRSQSDSSLRDILNPHPNDKIIFDLRPNLDLTFQRVPVKTNSCGMRDVETLIPKPANTYRIALLGDSFAFGWGVNRELAFGEVLAKNLNRFSSERLNVEVLNFGIPGYSTFQEVEKFKEDGINFNPDAVLVFFVENDFGLPFYVRDINNPGDMMPATDFAPLSWQPKDPRVNEQRLQLLGYDANSALRDLADQCREHGIKLFLAINPRKEWHTDLQRLWILRDRSDIQLIRLRKPMLRAIKRAKIDAQDLSLPNDPHPSPLKHRLLANFLTPYFMESL